MKKLKPFLSLVVSLLFLNPKALALSEVRFPEFPSKNEPVTFSLQLEHFQTHTNYKEMGKQEKLASQNSFQYIAFHPRFSYSPFPLYLNFEIFANNFYASSKTGNTQRTVYFRPTVLGAGFSSYHKIKTLFAGLEIRGGVPLYGNLFGNLQSANEIIVGDGSYFIEPGVWLIFKPSDMFYVYINSAFRYRFSSLSSLVFARLGGALTMQNIDAGVSIDPFFSVLSDPFASQSDTRHNLLEQVNGGSYKFYSVNPSSFLAWTLWMEFKYRPAFIKLYFHLDTFGQNYAKGLNLGLVTKFKWNTKRSIIHRQHNTKFDFDEKDFGDSPSEEDSYFDEEEDPYNKKNLNKELKEELNFLRY